jgi:hypothetical protein
MSDPIPRTTMTFVAIVAALMVLAPVPLKHAVNEAKAPAKPANSATPVPKTRLGTYDGRALAVAFAPLNKGRLAELLKEAKEAQDAGDAKKLEELRVKGSALQIVRHLQAFGNAPVDDILQHVSDQLPDVAQKAGVCAIVQHLDFRDSTVETVDVTDQLVALFDPDERTLTLIQGVRNYKPMTLEAVLVAEHQPRK